MGFVHRNLTDVPVRTGASPAEGCDFAAKYPALWEYLTLERHADGEQRETATLLIFGEQGCWKACLNDREHDRSAWATATTFAALLERLEASLEDGSAEWRRKQPLNGRHRR